MSKLESKTRTHSQARLSPESIRPSKRAKPTTVEWRDLPFSIGFITFGFLSVREVVTLARVSKFWLQMVGAPGSFRYTTIYNYYGHVMDAQFDYQTERTPKLPLIFPGRASLRHIHKLCLTNPSWSIAHDTTAIEQVDELVINIPSYHAVDGYTLQWISGLLDTCLDLKIEDNCREEVIECIVSKAKTGNLELQTALGAYYQGHSMTSEAQRWLCCAAEGGYLNAMSALSTVLMGLKDFMNGELWLKRGALAGHDKSELMLAVYLYNNDRMKEGWPHALRQATRGNRNCQLIAGWGYEMGDGVAQDFVKAMTWYKRASDRGCLFSMHNISRMYRDGAGVKKDPQMYLYFLMKGANQNDYECSVSVGDLYRTGFFGHIDRMAAVAWYTNAMQCSNLDDTRAYLAMAECYTPGTASYMSGPKRRGDDETRLKFLKLAVEHETADEADMVAMATYFQDNGDTIQATYWLHHAQYFSQVNI